MKKLLFFLLLSVFAFGQTKKKTVQKKQNPSETAIKRATTYFKNEYVPVYFKDKYSYQLKDSFAVPHSFGENIENDLISVNRELSYLDPKSSDFSKEDEVKYHKLIEEKDKLESLNENLNDDIKNKIQNYSVFIDCYAANSFGLKVLSKYVVDISPDGTILEVMQLDN